MRLFLAFECPECVRDYVRNLQDVLRKEHIKGKYVRPESLHLTVLFLGDQDEQAADTVIETVDRVCSQSAALTLTLDGLETFGSPPRVLVLDWDEEPERAFAEFGIRVRDAVSDAGIELKKNVRKRDPLPHLTLLRFRGRREAGTLKKLGEKTSDGWRWQVSFPAPPGPRRMTFSELCLYESTLRPEGAAYKVLHRFPLQAT